MSTTPLRYADGPAIRDARRALGLTQQQVAERVGGISQITISQIECGTRDASIRVLSRLCDVLRVERGPFLRSESTALMAAADPQGAAA